MLDRVHLGFQEQVEREPDDVGDREPDESQNHFQGERRLRLSLAEPEPLVHRVEDAFDPRDELAEDPDDPAD